MVMKTKIISIFIAVVMLLGYPVFADNPDFPASTILSNVFGPSAIEDITQGYIVFEDGTSAEMSLEDIEAFLSSHLNFSMDRYTQPFDPANMAYPYFNFYTQDGAGYTFYRSNALCACFGEHNYLWYQPQVGNAQNMLSKKIEGLSTKYKPLAKPIQQQPVFPERDALKLPDDDWAIAEVKEAVQNNIVPIALTENYSQAITREDFCLLINQMLAQIQVPGSSSDIIDISENLKQLLYEKTGSSDVENFYTDCDNSFVNGLSALGIINGRGNGIFDPEGAISREEAAKILYQTAGLFMDLTQGDVYYNDIDRISSWAVEAVTWAKITNIMQGVGGECFEPQGTFTVEQAIITVRRLFHWIQNPSNPQQTISLSINGEPIVFENKPFIKNEMVYFPLDELIKKANPANHVEYGEDEISIHIEDSIDLYKIAVNQAEIIYHPIEQLPNGYAVRDTNYAPVLKNKVVYIPYEYVQYILANANGYKISGSSLYQNHTMNIQFEIPLRWAGKYNIDESFVNKNSIIFKHKATANKYDDAGTLFRVSKLTNAELEESLQIFGNQSVVWQNDAYSYVISRPTDVQYPIWADRDKEDIGIAEEYEELYADIEHIEKTFTLIKEDIE